MCDEVSVVHNRFVGAPRSPCRPTSTRRSLAWAWCVSSRFHRGTRPRAPSLRGLPLPLSGRPPHAPTRAPAQIFCVWDAIGCGANDVANSFATAGEFAGDGAALARRVLAAVLRARVGESRCRGNLSPRLARGRVGPRRHARRVHFPAEAATGAAARVAVSPVAALAPATPPRRHLTSDPATAHASASPLARARAQ